MCARLRRNDIHFARRALLDRTPSLAGESPRSTIQMLEALTVHPQLASRIQATIHRADTTDAQKVSHEECRLGYNYVDLPASSASGAIMSHFFCLSSLIIPQFSRRPKQYCRVQSEAEYVRSRGDVCLTQKAGERSLFSIPPHDMTISIHAASFDFSPRSTD